MFDKNEKLKFDDDDHDDEADVHHAEQKSVEAFFGHFWPNLEN